MFLVLAIGLCDASCKIAIMHLVKVSDLILTSACRDLLFASTYGERKMVPTQKVEASCLLCL